MKTRKPETYGEYCEHGYKVFVNGQEVYRAGNHYQESSCQIHPGNPFALPLRTLRSFCISTCREVATEKKGRYLQVERIAPEDL